MMLNLPEYEELKRTIENVQFKTYEPIKYNGIEILLFPCQQTFREQKRGSPPIFFNVSGLADYDIYFGMNVVPQDFRKPCLLHEVLEIALIEELKSRPGITNRRMFNLAHRIARRYDLKYAKEIFSKERYLQYIDLREILKTLDLPGLVD
jgi:hypothetical protein